MGAVDCTQEDHQTNASVSLALPSLLLFLLSAGVKADLLDFQLFCTDHGGIDGCVAGTMELQQMDLLDTGNNTERAVGAQCLGKIETLLLSNFCEGETMALKCKSSDTENPQSWPSMDTAAASPAPSVSAAQSTQGSSETKASSTGASFCCSCG